MTTETLPAVAADPYFAGIATMPTTNDAERAAKAEREALLGTLKNKGWDQKPAIEVLRESLKSYGEIEKHLGIPREQLVRMPKDAADKEGWQAFNKRIGVPDTAEGYDFSKVKFADGSDLDDSFAGTMRTIMHARGVPAANAADLVADIVKYMDQSDADEATQRAAKIAEGRDELARSWGAKMESNKFIASQAAQKLGLSEDFVTRIENEVGYKNTMEQFLKLGQMMGEDKFVANHEGPAKGVLTREQAQARLEELKRDASWVSKVNAGDHKANEEFSALTRIMSMGV